MHLFSASPLGDNISFYRICFIFHLFWPRALALLILFYLFIVNTIDSQKMGSWWEINFSSKNNNGCVHRGRWQVGEKAVGEHM